MKPSPKARPLIIRDGHASINGDKTVYKMPSGSLDIICEDGRTLFSVRVTHDGQGIEVTAVSPVRVDGKIFSDSVLVKPRASNSVNVLRAIYES